jgi:hypothetical protein
LGAATGLPLASNGDAAHARTRACPVGDLDTAFDYFERAVETRDILIDHTCRPDYDDLRAHPRDPALMRKMSLEP